VQFLTLIGVKGNLRAVQKFLHSEAPERVGRKDAAALAARMDED
jgi:hypothetical protein